MELSHILNQTRRKEDHLVRKIRKLKEKISQLQAIEAHNSAAYKKRIEEYETVLNKICRNIEFQAHYKLPESLQKEINQTLEQYQLQIKEMNQSIMILNKEKEELERERDSRKVTQVQSQHRS